MTIDTLYYRKQRLLALTLLVLIAAGLSALASIGRQEDPTITNLSATISTVYPGADPVRVESLVTRKIETELNELSSIATLTSRSSAGLSLVTVELEETIDTDLIDSSWADVRAALDDAQLEFPAGVLEPEFSAEEVFTYSSIVALVPGEGMSLSIAARYAEALADHLRRLSGTEAVNLYGEVEEEVLVTIEPSVLGALTLSVDDVSRVISSIDAKVQSGRVSAPTYLYRRALAISWREYGHWNGPCCIGAVSYSGRAFGSYRRASAAAGIAGLNRNTQCHQSPYSSDVAHRFNCGPWFTG